MESESRVLAGRLSLGKRITLLVVLGLAAVLLVFGFLSLRSLRQSSDRALNERLMAAQLTAHHLDSLLGVYLETLGQGTDPNDINVDDLDLVARGELLERLHRLGGEMSHGVFLLDRNGRMILGAPAQEHARLDDLSGCAIAGDVIATGRPRISNGYVDPVGRRLVSLAVPVWGRDGRPVGALVRVLDLTEPLLAGFVNPVSLGQTGYAELVDSQGMVLASSKVSHLFQKSDHTDQFAGLIQTGRPTVGTCHSCHETGGESQVEPEVLAFAPLSVAPWGVAIRQSEAEALAPAQELRGSLVLASMASLLATACMVLLCSRGVVSPVKRLIAASRRMAAGDLESRVEVSGPAEIGELARAFDETREKLKACLDNLERVNSSLELRVEERTRQLSALLDKVIVAQEEERRRIARELHDDTCQSLAALAIKLEEVEESLPESADASRAGLLQLKSRVRATLAEVRTLALNLRPSALDDLGLTMAIDWYAREQVARRGLEVRLELDDVGHQLAPSVETVLFRIAQEALNNVAKHSGATSATVRLGINGSRVLLQVEDDGLGFDVDRMLSPGTPSRSLGLHGMIERAALSGGVLRVLSTPGRGTRIQAELRLQRAGGNRREEDLCIAGR